MPLDDLREAARIVRCHQERFDGEGYPDGLAGFNIPIGACVLAVASDYDNLQIGTLMQRQLRPEQAIACIIDQRGRRYDPAVVEAFQDVVSGRSTVEKMHDVPLSVADLRPGMTTSRDLVTRDGALLLSTDHVLSERLIAQIADFERASGTKWTIYVRKSKEET